jgi:endonuclease/exonuclease/phosphatase family metal-dependent hydrolase
MSKEIRMTNAEGVAVGRRLHEDSSSQAFGFRNSSFTRHSSFVIRHSRRVVLAVVVACGLVAWQGSDRVPTGAASGTQFDPPAGHALRFSQGVPPDSRDTIRVATFNIHGGRGTDGVQDLSRIADLLKGFDLVGLNEVHAARIGSGDNQASGLGKTLDQPWLFAPTERRWWRDDFGNAVLTKLAVDHWYRLPLPATQGAGFRNVVWLTIPWRDRTVTVLVTHLDRTLDRETQLRTALNVFQSLATPAILMGDFNTTAIDPMLYRFLAESDAIDALGSPDIGNETSNRIDWILARGLSRVDSGCVPTTASDHPLMWAELRLDDELSDSGKNTSP